MSEVQKILENGYIKSKLFSEKSDASLWQSEVTMQLTDTAEQALYDLLMEKAQDAFMMGEDGKHASYRTEAIPVSTVNALFGKE